MAVYRGIYISFWDDVKVVDDFTPEDKLFFLYLLTNPHSNIAGCYPLSIRQIVSELGYPAEKVRELLERMENDLEVIRYDADTKEVLVLNWYKYNWIASSKFCAGLKKSIDVIKSDSFRGYLREILTRTLNGKDGVSIRYGSGIDTVGITEPEPEPEPETETETEPEPGAGVVSENPIEEIRETFSVAGVSLSDLEVEELKGYLEIGMDTTLICLSAVKMREKGKTSWRYARGILNKWAAKGIRQVYDLQQGIERASPKRDSDIYIPPDEREELERQKNRLSLSGVPPDDRGG